jgi:secreted trypsin-like serine protease
LLNLLELMQMGLAGIATDMLGHSQEPPLPRLTRCLTLALASMLLCAPADAGSQPELRPSAPSISAPFKPQRTLQPGFATQAIAPDAVSPMIVGGTDAAEGVHPFQVALINKSYSDDFQAQFCGGTLVADRFVVTAAHCSDTITDPASQVQVLVGARRLDGSGRRIDVTRVYIHPGYDAGSLDYDVAVWQLATPVTGVSYARVTSSQPATPGVPLRATGWGTLNDVPKPQYPVALQQVDLPFVPTVGGRCKQVAGVTPRMICAGGSGVSSCYGDSGGPLTIERGLGFTELVGITSWGVICGGDGLPAGFANVAESSINQFIRTIMSGAAQTIQFRSGVETVSEGARRVTLTLTRTSAGGPATVRYRMVSGTALAKSDYRSVSGTVAFRPGSDTATVTITIINDRKREGREYFNVVLGQASSGWSVANGLAEITITDND